MKHIFYRLYLALAFVAIASQATLAQSAALTAAEKEIVQKRVKDKVDELQFYIKQMADKESTSPEVKNNAYALAIKLFIGEGEPYSIYDAAAGYEMRKPGVKMQTASKGRSGRRSTPIKQYLNNLRNNRTYSQIEITDADAVYVDNIEKVGDHYEATAYFCQKYIGYRDRRVVYSDITTKKVKVYISLIEIPKPDGNTQRVFNALLGDIYVVDIY